MTNNPADNLTPSDAELQQLAATLGSALGSRGWLLATAESLTGGWIAKTCTDVVGSSQWFDRGFVTYSIEAKHDLLGVAYPLIQQYGVVSEAVAAAMAGGALDRSRAAVAVAVTGIAGPGGGDAVPVGAVCCAWMDQTRLERGALPEVQTFQFTGNRDQIRRQTVWFALHRLQEIVEQPAPAERQAEV